MAILSLLAAVGLFAVPGAFAQDAAATTTTTTTTTTTPATDNTVKLDKYTVTGSYIPAAADESKAMPVQVITAKTIEESGIDTSVLDLLRKQMPAIMGSNNVGVENANVAGGFNNGATEIALHNTTTLVLINGKRVAYAPVSAAGASGTGAQFVDLSQVPASAIERIEVLTDGASAIYGSEAVSGVVNIILKKDYEGMQIGGTFGFAKKDSGGFYQTRSANMISGASNKDTSITVSASWSRTDPLYEREMKWTSPAYGTASFPGVINSGSGQFYILAPGVTTPPAGPTTIANLVAAGIYVPISATAVSNIFDLSHFPTFLGSSFQQGAILNISHALTDNLAINADFLYSKTGNQYNLNAQPISFSVNSILGVAGVPITDAGFTVRNRLSPPVGPLRIYTNDTTSIRGNVTLDGKIADKYTYQIGALYNQANQDAIGYNQILNSALKTAIAAGTINLFSTNISPAALKAANIFGNSININTTKLVAYNALVGGAPFDIWSGPVQFALGAEWRKTSGVANADLNSLYNAATGTSAWNNGVTINPFNAFQTVKSYFGEIKLPVTSPENNIPGAYLISLDAAFRHESYTGGNSVTVPKYSIRWLPLDDQLALRATISKSFNAPSLYSLYGPTSQGATSSTGGLTAYNSAGVAIGLFPPLQGQSRSGSNPNLTPSTAKGSTIGFVLSPAKGPFAFLKGFSLTADYYHILEDGLVGTGAGALTIMQSVDRYGTASPYFNQLSIGNFPNLGGTRVTGPGQVSPNPANVYVETNLQNISNQTQAGTDITLAYTHSTAAWGQYTLTSTWNYLQKFVLDGYNYVGQTAYGTLPHARTYTSLEWKYDAFTGFLGFQWIKSATDSFTGAPVASYNSVDFNVQIDLGRMTKTLKGMSLTLGVNNAFDHLPPLDPDTFSNPSADTGTYGSLGRFYYVGAKYKF